MNLHQRMSTRIYLADSPGVLIIAWVRRSIIPWIIQISFSRASVVRRGSSRTKRRAAGPSARLDARSFGSAGCGRTPTRSLPVRPRSRGLMDESPPDRHVVDGHGTYRPLGRSSLRLHPSQGSAGGPRTPKAEPGPSPALGAAVSLLDPLARTAAALAPGSRHAGAGQPGTEQPARHGEAKSYGIFQGDDDQHISFLG